MDPGLPHGAERALRAARHADVLARVAAMIDGEHAPVSVWATAAAELHAAFDAYHWTGFYLAVRPDLLVVGPYQGGHGCLRIEGGRGVCGAAAAARQTVLVPDVEAFPDHIACSSTTRSEIVVPVLTPGGRLLAVLDLDSDHPAAFDATDQAGLEAIAADLGAHLAMHLPDAPTIR